MSKWEDTVMSAEQISNIRYEALKEALKATDIASAQCGEERGSGFFGFSGFSDKENREYFEKTYLKEALERIAQAQAEISFPAGEKQGIQQGRKEVVEWIESVPTRNIDGAEQYIVTLEQWQALKRKWGIE